MPSRGTALSRRIIKRRQRKAMPRAANVDMETVTELMSNEHPEGLYIS